MQSGVKKAVLTTGIIGAIICIFIILILVMRSSVHPVATNSPKQSPQVTTTDLAPSIPNGQKTAILIMHGDSSYEKFIVANSVKTSFIKSLPTDDKVISQTPIK